uniref:PNT domain-containing protein n=1 Tax=Leptobrachium leishanense TaxID=445787 RepID=A0A8C5LTV2_9ANUR
MAWQCTMFGTFLLNLVLVFIDPMEWSIGNVQKWILWTEHQYRLPQSGRSFQDLTGRDLCSMSEDSFKDRSPLCGDVLYAHLDIWKSAAWMKEKTGQGDLKSCGGSGGVRESWTDSEVDSSSSGQPIHLWQFLKELLLKPHSYGRSIRWLNKEKDSEENAVFYVWAQIKHTYVQTHRYELTISATYIGSKVPLWLVT